MFCKSVVLSDEFLDMPTSTRCLYLVLSMLADDDGFVNSPKSAMRQSGATMDDMKILVAKKYVIVFDSSLLVIKHWKMNNYIQKDRYTETKYLEQKQSLFLDENKAYTQTLESAKYTVYGEEITDVYRLDTQVRLGKDSIGKDSINTTTTTISPPTPSSEGNEKTPSVEVDYLAIAEYFIRNHYISSPSNFYTYNKSRGWVGIGGEDVSQNWEHYADMWELEECRKLGQDITLQELFERSLWR